MLTWLGRLLRNPSQEVYLAFWRHGSDQTLGTQLDGALLSSLTTNNSKIELYLLCWRRRINQKLTFGGIYDVSKKNIGRHRLQQSRSYALTYMDMFGPVPGRGLCEVVTLSSASNCIKRRRKTMKFWWKYTGRVCCEYKMCGRLVCTP